MSDSDDVLPKKRAAKEEVDATIKKVKEQEADSDYEPTDDAGSVDSEVDLLSDEGDHGDIENFDAEAYLRYCRRLGPDASENGVGSDEEHSEEGETQKPTSCSQDQESSD